MWCSAVHRENNGNQVLESGQASLALSFNVLSRVNSAQNLGLCPQVFKGDRVLEDYSVPDSTQVKLAQGICQEN